MKTCKNKAIEMVRELIPNFEKIEFSADIFNNGYSIEFFVVIDGVLNQNYELVDKGVIDESKMGVLFKKYADYVRSTNLYSDNNGKCLIEFSE